MTNYVYDGGCPRIITGVARETIVGGNLIGVSGAAGVVGSDVSTFSASDIEFVVASTGNFVGVAITDAVSGAIMSVATRGTSLLPVSGTNVLAGTLVSCNADNQVINGSATIQRGEIGRALTTGSSGEYVVVDIHG